MTDYVIRATAANNHIRAFAIRSTEMTEHARQIHGLSPVMTAALGRLMSAAAMMGSMMKGEKDLLTIQYRCDGPAGGMTVTAGSNGNVKGYVVNPQADVPVKYPGKLDVGGAVGRGILTVSMDLGLRDPYSGQVEIQTGEIGEDLAYYFTVSEQTPSAVGLGVKVDRDCSVMQSGGFIIQLMPFAEESVISALEEKLAGLPPVTTLLEQGMTPEDILQRILGDLGLEVFERCPVRFHCDCSKEKVSRALSTLSRKDLDYLIKDGEEIEVKCYFCNRAYTFGLKDLAAIRQLGETGNPRQVEEETGDPRQVDGENGNTSKVEADNGITAKAEAE